MIAPLRLDAVFADPDRILGLVRDSSPYWNQARYLPAAQRAATATTPTGHPHVMAGGAPPLFRGDWHSAAGTLDGAGPIVADEVLREAACELFGGASAAPSFLYVNVTAPMPGLDTGHVDVPAFRGVDRSNAPGWLLLAMNRSALFERWLVRTATAVVWFYAGSGGTLTYWPAGPDGGAQLLPATTNTALVGDNDRMFHRVDAVGEPDRWRSVARDSTLHHAGGTAWEVRDGGEVVERYDADELRISLSWKAEVFLDDAERAVREQHTDDLTPQRALAILAGALDGWAVAPSIEDPLFVEAVMRAYPRTTVTAPDARR